MSSRERDRSGPTTEKPGVLGGRADERDPAVLDGGKQCILLGAREAVDLVDEEDGLALPRGDATFGVVDHRTHVLDARSHCGQFDEAPVARDQVREGGLAGARRTPQDDRGGRSGLPHEPA
ncbi:hypothetical protein GCM10025876_00380 [Demequina litorisediminis]|uniref:Uncharacterized protein n=1 Tax=Demequina litorisediminis TaxID=1849022 RepID=A0ABQ6I7N8_9MICO|nr:hypothetical protein GCM10025876_00380 [Demequina litorisediminis]